MIRPIRIAERLVGPGQPTYVVAELSANHRGRLDDALAIVEAAAEAGADAVKLQTYTPDSLTIRSARDEFRVGSGSLWAGRTLYDLYAEAQTPWEWHAPLAARARELGLDFFSTPFDAQAVAALDALGVRVFKIASFELIDTALLQEVARRGKPVILSTGLATHAELIEAVGTLRSAGCRELALLKCTSAYPAPPDEMNLRAIPAWQAEFELPVGLSDHTLSSVSAVAAVALGASIVEKHLTLSRAAGGPDAAFSLEPAEFADLVRSVRTAEQSLGSAEFELGPAEAANRAFRRSLFVVADMRAGEPFTTANVRSIRPGQGLAPKHLPAVLGARAACDIARGTPLAWSFLRQPDEAGRKAD